MVISAMDTLREAVMSDERSQAAIARASGVSETGLSHFMRGKRAVMALPATERLASALGLRVELVKAEGAA